MQWPTDFPPDKKEVVVKKPKVDPEQEAANEKKELLDYAQRVTQEATDYRDSLVQADKEKAEAAKLAKMGMPGEEVTL